jgi:lysophospholipase L1-like esterase
VKLALALLAATGCAVASGSDQPKTTYLALGDSVAFGFSPLVDLRTTQVSGYPELLGADRGLDVENLACPGEASGGFTSPTGADNHCRENKQMYPLHVAYDGTQLQAALDRLATDKDIGLVTIDLGANDVFLLQHMCGGEALTCILENFVGTMTAYGNNLELIFTQLRRVYDGPIVALTIYNPYPADDTAAYAIGKIDDALAAVAMEHGAIPVDGLAAFTAAAADPCASGLLIKLPDGTCDVHPTPAGAKVLADAIQAVLP